MPFTLDDRGKLMLGLAFALLTAIGTLAGREYTHRQTIAQLTQQSASAQAELVKLQDVQKVMVAERMKDAEELATLHRQAKAWERGSETRNADGSTTRTWDNGSESAEDSLRQASQRIIDLQADVETSKLQLAHRVAENETLMQQLDAMELETKRAAKRFGVLAGYELGGEGDWTHRVRLGGVGFLGPWMVGATLGLGPSMDGTVDLLGRLGTTRTTAWAGWAF